MKPLPKALPLLLLLAACKVEPIADLELDPSAVETMPVRVVPLSTERHGNDRRAQRWDESLRRYVGFLSGQELGGRRPGTEGATLTEGFVITVLEGAGLSPNGPDLGWTQPVGVRVVETAELALTLQLAPEAPAEGEEVGDPPPPQRFDEGLWLQHRGAAGPQKLELRLDEGEPTAIPSGPAPRPGAEPTQDPEQGPRERLEPLPLPAVPEESDPRMVFREVFDSAWRDGVDVAVLPIPAEERASLRTAAEGWQRPEIQSLLLGRDPPAALDLEGFVRPEIHQALLEARVRPGSTATIEYTAQERWFEDANVIGRIAGGRRPEQAVVVVAHWDAGGLDEEAASEPSDDAGGLAVMLAVAEHSGAWRDVGRRPDRSLVFVATAAGSVGHRGAARFVEASGIRPSNIVAVINLEDLGGTESDLLVLDGERSSLIQSVQALDPTARSVPDQGQDRGHQPFLERRVPAVTLSRPVLPDEQGVLPPPSIPTLRADAELVFQLVWQLSDRSDTPRLITAEKAEAAEAEPKAPPVAPEIEPAG